MADDSEPEIIRLLKEGDIEGVKRYLREGGDINATDQQGRTALHHSIILREYRTRNILLNKGADVNAIDNYGYMPISYYNGGIQANKNIVALLEKGANPNSPCIKYTGDDALPKNKSCILYMLLQHLRKEDIHRVKRVIELGCDPNFSIGCSKGFKATPC